MSTTRRRARFETPVHERRLAKMKLHSRFFTTSKKLVTVSRKLVTVVFLAISGTSVGRAQTAYPMLMSVKPVAVQAGTEADLTISSRYSMTGGYRVLISGDGAKA